MNATVESDSPLPPAAAPAPEPVVAAAAVPKTLCPNCGAELFGAYCYACGQPLKGMIRHLASILHDALDTIFNIDSRIFRTIFPLYFRPGFLTTEYFAGRRVRYVTPFRLYFFLCIIAFVAIQWGLDSVDLTHGVHLDAERKEGIHAATTAEEVGARRDAALAEVERAKADPSLPRSAVKGLEKAAASIREDAERRTNYLRAVADAKAKAEPAPPDPDRDEGKLFIGGEPWDPTQHPIAVAWLPDSANAKLNQMLGRMVENAKRVQKDPKPLVLGAIDALPKVLFVLMPLFALLLKIFYIFKRRLYMEHLIVALHSHSFIFMWLLLLLLATLGSGWAHSAAPPLETTLDWVIFAMGWWLPLYLLIMQKRVYRQGWFFTIFKYCLIGLCYTIMIALGISVAFVTSLATI